MITECEHTFSTPHADCIHTGSAGLNTAFHDSGDATWTDPGGVPTISGVGLFSGLVPVDIAVPDRFGHHVESSSDVIKTLPERIRRHGPG
jgi:hypothetical protein